MIDPLAELRARLAVDRAALATELGFPEAEPVTFEPLGDPHRGGRRVTAVVAGGRRVIYKPRPVGAERLWGEFTRWLDLRDPEIAPVAPRVLARDGYGWTEWLEPRRPDGADATRRLAVRSGALLAAFDVLEFRDAHAANVFATGDRAAVVDAETLAHPRFAPWRETDSAVLTGFLPWIDARPTILGAIDPAAVGGPLELTELVGRGYQEGYRVIAEGRGDLLAPEGPLGALAELSVRVVLRPSERYLGIAPDRWPPADLGAPPWSPEFTPPIVASERRQLAAGDVPVFHVPAAGRDLLLDDGVVPGFFGESGLDRIRRRLASLSDADRDRALGPIRGSVLVAAVARDGG